MANEIADQLNGQIGPKYYADVEVQTALEEVNIALPTAHRRPDVSVVELPVPAAGQAPVATAEATIAEAPVRRVVVKEEVRLRTVNIFLTETEELVTAIEILSPYNKRGAGLDDYRHKRSQILRSPVHLVEIDLLRGGERPGHELTDPPLENADYVLLVNRHHEHESTRVSEIWPVALDQPLPLLPIPLLAPDPDVALDLNAAIRTVYRRAGYDWRLTYELPAPPPDLRPELVDWMEQLIQARQEKDAQTEG